MIIEFRLKERSKFKFSKGEYGNKYVKEIHDLGLFGKHSYDKFIPHKIHGTFVE